MRAGCRGGWYLHGLESLLGLVERVVGLQGLGLLAFPLEIGLGLAALGPLHPLARGLTQPLNDGLVIESRVAIEVLPPHAVDVHAQAVQPALAQPRHRLRHRAVGVDVNRAAPGALADLGDHLAQEIGLQERLAFARLPEPALNDERHSFVLAMCLCRCTPSECRVVSYAMMAWGALARCSTATSTISSAVGTNGMLTSD